MLNKKQLLLVNCACLLTYALGAYIGQWFTSPPFGTTPIWPPAGIALVMLLLYRNAVLPSIFLGAFIVQSYLFFNSSSIDSILNSLLFGSFISLGVCLQAWLAVYLIKRTVGEHNPLTKDVYIARLLFLGSVAGSAIAPFFKALVLLYINEINIYKLLSTWLIGIASNVTAILIITPLMLIFLAHPRELWKKRRNYVAHPLFILLYITVLIFQQNKQQESEQIAELFERQSVLFHDALSAKLKSHLNSNLILKSFFDNSTTINEKSFQKFSKNIFQQQQGIQRIEWISYVKAAQRDKFESANGKIHDSNHSKGIIKTTEHDDYFPITYIEPIRANKRALGFDLGSNPIALRNIRLAWKRGKVTVTEKQPFTKPKGIVQGMVIYSPVYHKENNLASIDNKKESLKGFVSSTFYTRKEIKNVMKGIPKLQLLVEIKDADTLIYSNFFKKRLYGKVSNPPNKIETLKFANRDWQINYTINTEFIKTQRTWEQWWLLLGCFLFTGLSGGVLLMLTGRTLRTEELVTSRTHALHKEIAERERRNNVLHAIASPMPLNETLSLIIEMIENDNREVSCLIMLLDREGKHLLYGSSGRLSALYTDAVEGIKIGEDSIACASAAYLKQRVIVTDISQHKAWHDFFEPSQTLGLAACFSEPILSTEQDVLGTFTVYYASPQSPDKIMLDNIEGLAQLSGLAIEKKTSDERIRYLAFYDALTKLPNRRLLYDRLTQELAWVERNHNYGSLMFLDLDHFKTLNDSLGHHVGDELLIQVADRLKECVRDEDTVARLGGDEFVVLLRTKEHDAFSEQVSAYALTVAKRIQSALYIPYSLQGYEHVVTSSIGITMFGAENKDIDTLFKQADTAMYSAKNKGRNTFSFYNEDMANQADKRLQLESELRHALTDSQFALHYQSQHDATGKLIGAEALLRWIHPKKGMIAVADFMPTCEESGLILAIGEWTLRTVCQQLIEWPMLEHLSLNISSRQFHQPTFTEQIENTLAEYNLSPQRLMLEITEKIVVKDIDASIEKLNTLQTLGVRISIDDFGMGYSSLADLRYLPINQLKIDQSFIRDICTDKDAALIVEAMIMMANHLGLHIVAEGVETAEQLEFLQKNKNCNVYQGYYFNKPLPIEKFNSLLSETLAN